MPNNPRAGGVSAASEGEEREEAKEALNALNVPEGMGLMSAPNASPHRRRAAGRLDSWSISGQDHRRLQGASGRRS